MTLNRNYAIRLHNRQLRFSLLLLARDENFRCCETDIKSHILLQFFFFSCVVFNFIDCLKRFMPPIDEMPETEIQVAEVVMAEQQLNQQLIIFHL